MRRMVSMLGGGTELVVGRRKTVNNAEFPVTLMPYSPPAA